MTPVLMNLLLLVVGGGVGALVKHLWPTPAPVPPPVVVPPAPVVSPVSPILQTILQELEAQFISILTAKVQTVVNPKA